MKTHDRTLETSYGVDKVEQQRMGGLNADGVVVSGASSSLERLDDSIP